jgi:acyl-CoA thioester hydrolase
VLFEDSSLTLRVRPNDLDSLGHVNNATALEYLEAGRWAWLERNGLRQGAAVIGLTMRVEVDYRKEIAPQEVVVWTHLEAPEPEELDDPEAAHYRVRFHQKILIDSGRQMAVEAHVQAAFVRTADRSLCSLQEFLEAARIPKS